MTQTSIGFYGDASLQNLQGTIEGPIGGKIIYFQTF
jgi:hypothetical protein